MAENITIKISGIDELVKDYSGFRNNMRENMVVPLDDSAVKYLKAIHVNFNNQGRTFTTDGWPKLKDTTIAEKRRLGYPSQILVRTRALQRGFGRDIRKSANQAYIYNTQTYAIVHQEGAIVSYHGRNVTVPRRVLVDVDDERINMVAKIFTDWLNKLVTTHSM